MLKCVSQALIALEPTKTYFQEHAVKKEQDVTGEGDLIEVGQHCTGTKVLVLAPGDKQTHCSTSTGRIQLKEAGVD